MSEHPQHPQQPQASPEGAAPQLTEDEMAYVLSLFEMARTGDAENLLPAVRAGVPVNLTNSKGDTLLILAAYHQREETVTALLEAGADPDRVNDNGQTALMSAVFRGNEPIVRALLAAGASQTAGAHSALDFARVFERTELVPVLEEHTAR